MKKLLLLVFCVISLLWGEEWFGDWQKVIENNTEINNCNNLRTRVINYQKIRTDSTYNNLIKILEKSNPSDITNRNELIAYWINIYNIAAVNLISKHYPIKSINEVNTLFNSFWQLKAIKLADKTYSLNEIEYNILRKFNDPRIHFVLVSGTKSCPDLSLDVYTKSNLELMLKRQTFKFLKNKSKGVLVKPRQKIAYISPIFKWYESDFETSGGIKRFISTYLNRDIYKFDIKYLEYSWDISIASADAN